MSLNVTAADLALAAQSGFWAHGPTYPRLCRQRTVCLSRRVGRAYLWSFWKGWLWVFLSSLRRVVEYQKWSRMGLPVISLLRSNPMSCVTAFHTCFPIWSWRGRLGSAPAAKSRRNTRLELRLASSLDCMNKHLHTNRSLVSGLPVAHVSTVDLSLHYLLLNQLRSIQQAGYEVTGISSPGQEVSAIEATGISHIAVTRTRHQTPLSDLGSLWRLHQVMRREPFAIVHTHTASTVELYKECLNDAASRERQYRDGRHRSRCGIA